MSQPPNHSTPDEASGRPTDTNPADPTAQTAQPGGYGSGSYDPNAPIVFDSSYWDPSYNPAPYGAQPATTPAPYGAPPAHFARPVGAPPPSGGMPYGGLP